MIGKRAKEDEARREIKAILERVWEKQKDLVIDEEDLDREIGQAIREVREEERQQYSSKYR